LDTIYSVKGFLGGTSNQLIKTLDKVKWDIMIDLDKNQMTFKNDPLKKLLSLTKQDKDFINNIHKTVKKSTANIPSDDLSWNKIDNAALS